MTSGQVYLLPTPLGDSEPAEVLPRQTLFAARRIDYFLAENAKSARAFLKALEHPRPISAIDVVQIGHYPDPRLIDTWLRPIANGRDGAIVSEAGCPGLADPGAVLVARAHELGLHVVPLIGPAAPVLTLMASGLNGQAFRFAGYLPREKAACIAALRALEKASYSGDTQLFIETPYRNAKLFDLMLATCAEDTLLTVAIDLSTTAEFVATRTISHWRRDEAPPLAGRPCTFALLSKPRTRAAR